MATIQNIGRWYRTATVILLAAGSSGQPIGLRLEIMLHLIPTGHVIRLLLDRNVFQVKVSAIFRKMPLGLCI